MRRLMLSMPRIHSLRPCFAAVLAISVSAGAATAYVADPDIEALEITPPLEQTRFVTSQAEITNDSGARDYLQSLHAELGGGWVVNSWNQYSGAPRSVTGPGIVVAPAGLANATSEEVEEIARIFIADHSAAFRSDGTNLELTKIGHGANRWGVIFHQVEDGYRVQDSQVVLAMHDNGRLFAFGASLYGDIDTPPTGNLSPAEAAEIARSSVSYDPTLHLNPGQDRSVIVPIHVSPGVVDYHLAHITDVPTTTPMGMWRTWVDAESGEILFRDNQIEHAYEGSSDGDVEIYSYCDGETPGTPLANMFIDISGVGIVTTDENGEFSLAGDAGVQTATATFDGPDFDVECIECVDAVQTVSISPDTPLPLNFDALNSRADERDVFYFANLTKDYIEAIDPGFSLLKYTANVNIDAGCNASWGGTVINFFRQRDGCGNTGQMGSVVAHEMGHGIQDWATGGGQGPEGLGEGNGDITSTFMVDSHVIGFGFNLDVCDSGLRDCLNTLQYPEDLTGSIHANGRIICGFNWDLIGLLQAKLGTAEGKAKTAELWHYARALYVDNSNNQQDQVERYWWVDDDDGNLGNRTPNWFEICEAAEGHGYECEASPNNLVVTHTPLTDTLDPGPYTVAGVVGLYADGVPQVPDVVEMYWAANGEPFTLVDMTNTDTDNWEAVIPEQLPGSSIAYYILAADTKSGLSDASPAGAPAEYHSFAYGTFTEFFSNDMETSAGYTVGSPEDTAPEGQGVWERGDPVESVGGTAQPGDDHTENGTDCWITGNGASPSSPLTDELDGRTSFQTPLQNVFAVNMIQGSFWAWTRINTEDPENFLQLRMSNDDGANWTTIASVTQSTTPEWVEIPFRVDPWQLPFGSQARFQFVAQDGTGNIMEALVDDWFVEVLSGGVTGVESDADGVTSMALQLGSGTPNPFQSGTNLRFALPSRSDVELAVYDVHGRRVRSLVVGERDPGEHRVRWDGTSDAGDTVASGTYFAKMVVGDWSATQTLVLLR